MLDYNQSALIAPGLNLRSVWEKNSENCSSSHDDTHLPSALQMTDLCPSINSNKQQLNESPDFPLGAERQSCWVWTAESLQHRATATQDGPRPHPGPHPTMAVSFLSLPPPLPFLICILTASFSSFLAKPLRLPKPTSSSCFNPNPARLFKMQDVEMRLLPKSPAACGEL